MAPGSPPPAPASKSSAVQRAESALRGFTARPASHSPGLPQQPAITVTHRSGALQTAALQTVERNRCQDGLLPCTRSQLPLWYITLRQVVLDAYRAVAVVYRLANHVLGSLFEEFGPWWKWMVFDALLKLIARALARRSQRLESIFEAGMISAAEFAAGAQQLAAQLAACGGGSGGCGGGCIGEWEWRPIRSAFNRGPAAGHLVLRRTLLWEPTHPAASGSSGAAAAAVSSVDAAGSRGTAAEGASASVAAFDTGGCDSTAASDCDEAALPLQSLRNGVTQHSSGGGGGGRGEIFHGRDAPGSSDGGSNATVQPQLRSYEYHVLHSAAYGVPLLFLRGSHADGRPLSLDDIVADLPPESQATARQQDAGGGAAFLTLQPHPLLGTPCFGVHPCRTADLMAMLLPGGPEVYRSAQACGACSGENPNDGSISCGGLNVSGGGAPGNGYTEAAAGGSSGRQDAGWPLRYLLAWFSVVGAAVGLRLPPALWQMASRPP